MSYNDIWPLSLYENDPNIPINNCIRHTAFEKTSFPLSCYKLSWLNTFFFLQPAPKGRPCDISSHFASSINLTYNIDNTEALGLPSPDGTFRGTWWNILDLRASYYSMHHLGHLTTTTPNARVPFACFINISKLERCQPPLFHHRNMARGWREDGARQ